MLSYKRSSGYEFFIRTALAISVTSLQYRFNLSELLSDMLCNVNYHLSCNVIAENRLQPVNYCVLSYHKIQSQL